MHWLEHVQMVEDVFKVKNIGYYIFIILVIKQIRFGYHHCVMKFSYIVLWLHAMYTYNIELNRIQSINHIYGLL